MVSVCLRGEGNPEQIEGAVLCGGGGGKDGGEAIAPEADDIAGEGGEIAEQGVEAVHREWFAICGGPSSEELSPHLEPVGLTPGSHWTPRWRRQSRANPSLNAEFPASREFTGNFIDSGPPARQQQPKKGIK